MADRIPLYAETPEERARREFAESPWGGGGFEEPLPPPPETYNADRPSTWDAPDSPRLTTSDRAAMLASDEERMAVARAQLASAVEREDVEDEQAIRRGLGPGPMDFAGAAGVASGAAGERGNAYVDALLAQERAPSRPNPLRPIRERYAGRMGELTGIEEEQTAMLGDAQLSEQSMYAQAYEQEAGRQLAQLEVAEAKARRDAARQQAAVSASQLVLAKVSEASDRLNEMPDVDPQRYWKSQSAGRKFLWSIQAALAGFAGLDPFGALNSAIREDIDAQKATFAQRQAGVDARMNELGAYRGVYSDLRQAIVDEQATDLAMEQARLNQAGAAFKAMAIRQGIPVMALQNNIFLTQLQQRNAEIAKTLEELVVRTPERIGGGVRPVLRGPIRKTVERLADRELDEAADLRKLGITTGAGAATQERAIQADLEKERLKGGKQDIQEKRLAITQQNELEKATRDQRDAMAIIDNLLELSRSVGGGQPGKFGPLNMPDVLASDEQTAWNTSVSGLRLAVQRWASGAHLSPQQTEMVDRMVPTGEEWTGARALTKLRALRKFMMDISKSRQHGFAEETRRDFSRATDLPSLEAEYTALGADPVDVDE